MSIVTQIWLFPLSMASRCYGLGDWKSAKILSHFLVRQISVQKLGILKDYLKNKNDHKNEDNVKKEDKPTN